MTRIVAQWKLKLVAPTSHLVFLAALCEIHHMTSFPVRLAAITVSRNIQAIRQSGRQDSKTLAKKILRRRWPIDVLASFAQAFLERYHFLISLIFHITSNSSQDATA
ncbi:hypothetical protein F5Y06DRAFT_277961 [Hypoxylon sp. FL0890]|nr:hypothetical protein F5Y06DRAFT_277961 [Hypoxylon sp. FL0890]